MSSSIWSFTRCDCDGANVMGYFYSVSMDVFFWSNGYEKRYAYLMQISKRRETLSEEIRSLV